MYVRQLAHHAGGFKERLQDKKKKKENIYLFADGKNTPKQNYITSVF